jgi:hypothetical protein
MTSPGGSEHVSRYKALGEFDSLIRAAREAKRALKELREEEAKLNAQSLADDKKLAASKAERSKAEKDAADSAKRSVRDLNAGNPAGKAGEEAGQSYSRGVGRGISDNSQSSENRRFVAQATDALRNLYAQAGNESGTSFARNANTSIARETRSSDSMVADSIAKLQEAFGKAGDESGKKFTVNIRERFRRDANGLFQSSGFEYSLREFVDRSARAGSDSGNSYILGFGNRIKKLNEILPTLGQDKLDLDVDITDAQQSIKAIEIELARLSHETADPRVRIDVNRAMTELRALGKLFKDDVAEEMIKDSERIRKELEKVDALPSGRSFKFWALTALSDMSRVFNEADRGTSVFTRLRLAASGGGGGGNFLRTFISGFDDFSESSSNFLQKLGRVSGELYRMPGLIGVIVSSIPALVAGLGALGGGALGLASGLGAASGLLAALPGLGFAAIGSIGALTTTFGGLADVLKLAKKAQTEEAWAKEEARLGTNKALTATQKYKLAISELGPATGTVTEAIVGFADAWTQTSDIIGENFFKEVVKDVDDLGKLLPIAEDFFGKSATALGKVADEGLRMITSGPWKADFKTIAKNNATVIENLGGAGLHVADAFRHIAVAAGPFTGWLTKAIKEAAEAFADWAKNARSNGAISAFLGETKESLQLIWQILKNLGGAVSSFFKATVDEGQSYLKSLGDITQHWRDVAKAQEDANSPLRKWMTEIRPVLTSLGGLISDIVKGFGGLATNQNSISTMIALLDSLRTDVLPPILEILQHLNDSGIAVTVVKALGDMLEAIATFLDSGATQALTVFVTVLANFFELLFDIASLPGVSDVFGALAAGLSAVAAVSIVARFTGLFKLWEFFTWMIRNKGNLSGAFATAARGVAGLPTAGATTLPAAIPSTVARGATPSVGAVGAVGSEALPNATRQIDEVGRAATTANTRVGIFSRAVAGLQSAGNVAKSGLGGLVGFLGGPWGVAITAATIGLGVLLDHLSDQKREAKDTENAFISLKNAYKDLQRGDTSGVNALADTGQKFKDIITSAAAFKLSLTDVSGALNGQDQSLSRVNTQLDSQIALLQKQVDANDKLQEAIPGKQIDGQTIALNAALAAAKAYKDQINNTAEAQKETNAAINEASDYTRKYSERLQGLSQQQVDSISLSGDYGDKIKLLSGAMDTLASATATTTEKSKAYSTLIEYQKEPVASAIEATENWRSNLLSLSEALETNGNSLDDKTRAGLRNRDALEAAATATRELYLQDIASGTPAAEAIKKHKERIKELTTEADKTFKNKQKVRELIDAYGDIPDNMKTNILTDEKGFAAVYVELSRLQVMQKALQEGKSLSAAQDDWNKESQKFYQRPPTVGDGPGFATGGPVWGAGTKTSDSIRAWLSNGEFVHPADAVEHYGMPVMEALRTKKLDKSVIEEALPDGNNTSFASGGPAHSDNCASCASGGHKFADGGSVRIPIKVNPENTLVKKEWATQFAGALGDGGGGNGWKWQMNVLRAAFPGLPLISGYRPGARTLSGNRSYHSVGRAVDLPPRRDVAQWIRSNYGSKTKELITPYNDLNLHNGQPHRYTGAIWNQHNFAGGNAHDHWAFNQGGMVDLMKMMNMDNLSPSQSNSLPTTPRTLSPAASSVVNNSTDNGRTFGDVIINNPLPERAGDSVRDALYRTTLLY